MRSLDELLAGVPELPPLPEVESDGRTHTEAEVRDDLRFHDPNTRRDEGWFDRIIGIRCANIEGDDGRCGLARRVALEWSRGDFHKEQYPDGCPAFDAKTEGEIDSIFDSTKPVRKGGPSISYGSIAGPADDAREAAGEAPGYRQPNPNLDPRPAAETFGHYKPDGERKHGGWEGFMLHEFKDRPNPKYIVDQLLRELFNHLLFGASEAFKTFMALELMGAVASGMPAFGKFEVFAPGDVVFFCDEDPDSVMCERWPAYAKARGMADPFAREPGWPGRVLIVPRCPNVGSPQDAEDAAKYVESRGLRPKLAIIDTVAKALGGLNSDKAENVSIYVAAMTFFRRRWGCATLSIHHPKKDDPDVLRGSGAFINDFDVVINALSKTNSLDVIWKWHKTKGVKPKPMRFTGTPHSIGEVDQNGREISSLAFDYAGEAFEAGGPRTKGAIEAEHKQQQGMEAAARGAERKTRVLNVLCAGEEIDVHALAMTLERETFVAGESLEAFERRVITMKRRLERDVLSARHKFPGVLYDFAAKTSDGELVIPYTLRLPSGGGS